MKLALVGALAALPGFNAAPITVCRDSMKAIALSLKGWGRRVTSLKLNQTFLGLSTRTALSFG